MPIDYDRTTVIDANYRPIKTYIDPTYAEMTLMTDYDNKHDIVCKKKTIDNEREFKIDVVALRKRKELKHRNLIELIDWSSCKKSQLCSSYFIIKTYYAFHNHTFNKELEIRRSSNRPFLDEELSVLIYEQVSRF